MMNSEASRPSPSESSTKEPMLPTKVTLSDFVESNSKLLSTLGIFTAMSVVATNLPFKAVGYPLAFVLMNATILLWLELFGRFPAKGGTARLSMFEGLISISTLFVVVNWLVQFSAIWEELIGFVTFVLILTLLLYCTSALVKRLDLFNRVFRARPGEKTRLRFLVGVATILFLALLSMVLAAVVEPKAKPILREIREVCREFPWPVGVDATAGKQR